MNNLKFGRLRFFFRYIIGLMFLTCFANFAAAAQDADSVESPMPVLITENDSPKALAIAADGWRGALPKKNSDVLKTGGRAVFFLTNIELLPDENAGAFRAYLDDTKGSKFCLTVEAIEPLRRQPWIYGVTVKLFDANGYNGQPADDAEYVLRFSWRGNATNSVRVNLGVPTGKTRFDKTLTPMPAPLAAPNTNSARTTGSADRKRFMEQASFGPSRALDFRLRQIGLRRWIEDQFTDPYPSIPYPNFAQMSFDGSLACGGDYGTSPTVDLCHRNHLWQYNNQKWLFLEAFYGEDQLRRRISWALHQIWVVSGSTVYQQRWMQEYIEILDKHSFGNYRNLMSDMTLSPAMGEYLDMVRSTRQSPNENYPRELLQLFTIGLYMLNQDGTYKLDAQGNRIPTYDQSKIDQFTKVFTGWTRCDSGNIAACSNAVVGAPNFIDPMYLVFPTNHDTTAKTLFDYTNAPNQTITACANCTTDTARRTYAEDSLNKTLDNIFNHPNVGPFIGKLLIQHLVTSDPSPAYVGRVAAAFNNNGAGVRGDMKAVIRAILLDPEARGNRKTEPTYGKLREPLQYITNLARMFNVHASDPMIVNGVSTAPPASCQNKSDGVLDWQTGQMGQEPLNPPTVFNYFQPDYVVPGTDVLGPEFALANTSTSFARNNYAMGLSFGWSWFEQTTAANPYPFTPCGTSIDLSEPIAWVAADASSNMLIENLNVKMMHGTMSEAMKGKIRAALNFNVSAADKAKQAVYLIASSSQYQIQR